MEHLRLMDPRSWYLAHIPPSEVTGSFGAHFSPRCSAEGNLSPLTTPTNAPKAVGCRKANPSCPPHGPRAAAGRSRGNSQEACPLGKLFLPSVTLRASPVHTSSALARPSGKQRWKKSGRGLRQGGEAQGPRAWAHPAPTEQQGAARASAILPSVGLNEPV